MMCPDDKDIKNGLYDDDEAGGDTGSQDETGSGTAGGQSGQIEFRDFLAGAESLRDGELSSDEKRRLLRVHDGSSEVNIKKQKALLEERRAVREGKKSLDAYRQGKMEKSMYAGYKVHPLLIAFSIRDTNVSELPTENNAVTNERKQEELTYELKNRLRHTAQPKFNPKPTPFR